MIVRATAWQKIRDEFTFEEKARLSAAVHGEIMCPRGFDIDVAALPAPLAEKLATLLRGSPKW